MKRRILIFVIFLTIFGFEIVNAGSCPDNSEYDCAYCHYEATSNNCKFSYAVTYKGDGTPLEFNLISLKGTYATVECEFSQEFEKEKFKDSAGNVICPNLKVDAKVTSLPRGQKSSLTVSADVAGSIKPTESIIKKGTNQSAEVVPTIICKYDGYEISLIDGKVQINITSGISSETEISNALDPKLFENGNCPEVYTYHNTRGENKLYFSTDSSVAGRFQDSEGEQIDQNTNTPINSYVPDTLRPDLDNLSTITDCESLLGSPNTKPSGGNPGSPAYYMMFVFNIIKYIAIILLVTLSIVDFVKAIAAKDDDSIKKASNTTIKRLILCIAIFLLPTLIEVLLEYVHTSAIDTCGIK